MRGFVAMIPTFIALIVTIMLFAVLPALAEMITRGL